MLGTILKDEYYYRGRKLLWELITVLETVNLNARNISGSLGLEAESYSVG